jgi:hypothetical protein
MKYRDGYKYQLAEDFVIKTKVKPAHPINTHFITLDMAGKLSIKADYAWDGPSGWTIDTRNSMRGSLVHDALYQLIRHGLLPVSLRLSCDWELDALLKEDGMWKWRRRLWVKALRIGGAHAADPRNKKPILIAP